MNNQDYELAVRGAATISENDIATVVIRIDNDGEIRVGAYGDARGIDTIYDRICRAYLLTLSQEAFDEFIDEVETRVVCKPETFKGVTKNAAGKEVPIIVERYKGGSVQCSTAGGPFLLCELHQYAESRCSCCPLTSKV